MRTETIEKTFYTFDELSNSAKENARNEWRECGIGVDFECVTEYFATICGLLGLDLNQRAVKTMGGKVRYEPAVYWSVSYLQSDGAAFEGSYSHKRGAAKAIRKHAPGDTELQRIADRLQDTQKKHFYKLNARAQQTGRNLSMSIDVEHDDSPYRDLGDAEEEIKGCFRDLAHWLYCALRTEHEWATADEQVDESLRINEYEFDENGRMT